MNRIMPFALMLAPWVALGSEVQIAADFPGGNIVLKKSGGTKAQDPMSGKRDAAVNAGFEIPYALVGDVPVTPDSARAFGRDIARAVVAYLKAGVTR